MFERDAGAWAWACWLCRASRQRALMGSMRFGSA